MKLRNLKQIPDSRIPVYESATSNTIVEHILVYHFCFFFQELYNDGEIKRVYYDENDKIVALESDGDITPDII